MLILDRDVPAARLEPVLADTVMDDVRLPGLERQGLIRRPRKVGAGMGGAEGNSGAAPQGGTKRGGRAASRAGGRAVRFWDSSAVVPLLVVEPATAEREKQLRADLVMLVWWGTAVECASALQRLVREGAMSASDARAAEARLRHLEKHWVEVEPTQTVRAQTERLLRIHPLRAADALQLAAAVVACHHEAITSPFETAALRLADAAQREGFVVG